MTSASTLHTFLASFEGGNALTPFRSQQLLAQIQRAAPKVRAISARFIHWVESDQPLDVASQQQLQQLLTYGEPFSRQGVADATIIVTPRIGTVSPWASKATDIARNCGLTEDAGVRRVERGTEYFLHGAALSDAQRQAVAALLHDRMTESVLPSLEAAKNLFTHLDPVPMEHVDVLGGGRAALEQANRAWGLALVDDEIRAIFGARKAGVRLVLISDSCHSGSVTKGDSDDLDAGMPRARFLPPSVWMKADELPASRVSSLPIISGMSRSGGDLLMAGCLDTQFSWDTRFKGRPNGAFTYYALKTLAALPAGASYAQWFKAITPTYLPTNQLPQNPQLFGSRTARAWKVFA